MSGHWSSSGDLRPPVGDVQQPRSLTVDAIYMRYSVVCQYQRRLAAPSTTRAQERRSIASSDIHCHLNFATRIWKQRWSNRLWHFRNVKKNFVSFVPVSFLHYLQFKGKTTYFQQKWKLANFPEIWRWRRTDKWMWTSSPVCPTRQGWWHPHWAIRRELSGEQTHLAGLWEHTTYCCCLVESGKSSSLLVCFCLK